MTRRPRIKVREPLPWIAVWASLPQHHKSMTLAAALKNKRAWTHVVELWMWASQNRPDGDLSEDAPLTIAWASGYETDEPEAFRAALVRAGFLDEGNQLVRWDERQTAHHEREIEKKADDAMRTSIRRRVKDGKPLTMDEASFVVERGMKIGGKNLAEMVVDGRLPVEVGVSPECRTTVGEQSPDVGEQSDGSLASVVTTSSFPSLSPSQSPSDLSASEDRRVERVPARPDAYGVRMSPPRQMRAGAVGYPEPQDIDELLRFPAPGAAGKTVEQKWAEMFPALDGRPGRRSLRACVQRWFNHWQEQENRRGWRWSWPHNVLSEMEANLERDNRDATNTVAADERAKKAKGETGEAADTARRRAYEEHKWLREEGEIDSRQPFGAWFDEHAAVYRAGGSIKDRVLSRRHSEAEAADRRAALHVVPPDAGPPAAVPMHDDPAADVFAQLKGIADRKRVRVDRRGVAATYAPGGATADLDPVSGPQSEGGGNGAA